MKIRVSHEEEEEEEEDKHPAGICSGSLDKSMKIVLKDDEEVGLGVSKGPASAEPDGPFPSPRDHPKIYYIKQERFDPEEAAVAALGGGAGAVGEACFLKSLAQGRALGIAEVHGLYQASLPPGSSSEVSYIIPAAGSTATSAIASSSSSLAAPGFTIKAQPLPSDEVGFPQSSWKPVDLHGNEIIAHTVHGQVVHAPVKIVAAPDGKKFGCLCGKRFAVKPKRDRHIMLTFSLRPFGCSVCNKKFKLKHHLTEHMKTHDGNLYSCEDCGRKFRVQNCFLKHKELCKGQGWATACWTYK
ncbi:zinc finger and BTB domain-containing protein 9 [Alligator mississippiensis]|uniref:Zinc finger and BTB domain-containing protein 9 n=2 Tax=Alligator mississippiensis TaxID=8496 RepID=A0A151P656_ALLMI|nr:zinc finger and BTB domain-containing protein 9 [Alligator mississippiensis]